MQTLLHKELRSEDKLGTLALFGGSPVRREEFVRWPSFGPEEIAVVSKILRSGKVNYWTGEEGRHFEREFAEFHDRPYAVALANGTVALEAALYALDIGAGDDVIVPSKTFIASASCAVMRGARPVIADVDPVSQNITAKTIRSALTPRTRAAIVVHLSGWPCDMDPIIALARELGIKLIEDCAQAHGAHYKGRVVGSMGDAAAFSFCQDKIISTGGEGGMLVLNDRYAWKRAWSLKDHGKDYDICNHHPASQSFRWVHRSFGTNWRMTEMQSAIGRLQLRRLSEQVAVRQRNARILDSQFHKLPALRVTIPPHDIEHAYYKYYVFLRPRQLHAGWTRDRVVGAICAEGIPCFSGACSEIYREEAFASELRPQKRLPVAMQLDETSLMFLVHPTLTVADMLDTCRAVQKVLSFACNADYVERAS